MFRIFALLLAFLVSTLLQTAQARDLTGSGSSFVFPVMAWWAQAYEKATGDRILYQPIGSAAGITEIVGKSVDFAVTDAPLVDAQLLRDVLSQFPLVIGGIVPVINLDGLATGQLRLTGEIVAGIYLGKITRWNDPAIAALNQTLTLPDQKILPIYRSDGSGTTYNFTDYLSKVDLTFRAAVGVGTLVHFPVGAGIRGSSGVVTAVSRLKGAIGYVDFSSAVKANLSYALVRNHAGVFVPPSPVSFQAAVAAVDWMNEPDFHVSVANANAADAYPMVATSFVLTRTYPKDRSRADALVRFFIWVIEQGGPIAYGMGYLPLPADLAQQVQAVWAGEGRRM